MLADHLRVGAQCVSHAHHPGFGPTSLFCQLESEELIPTTLPLFSEPAPGLERRSPRFVDAFTLAARLERSNRRLGNPLPETVVGDLRRGAQLVLAGHQPSLLTGPHYVFMKAALVVATARRLSKQCGVPVHPAFWIAGDDHNIASVNRFFLGNSSFCATRDGHRMRDRMPMVGNIALGHRREPLLRFLGNATRDCKHGQWLLDVVERVDFSNYASQFVTFVKEIFPDDTIVFVDSEAVRDMSGEFLQHVLAHWKYLREALEEGRRTLAALGFDAPLDHLTLFRRVDGRRTRCLQTGTGCSKGDELAVRGLLDEVRRTPADFSPGVGLRPLVQDAMVPAIAYTAGHSEMSYMWQLAPLYRVLGLRQTPLTPRVSSTFLDESMLRVARERRLPISLLLDPVAPMAKDPTEESASSEQALGAAALELRWRGLIDAVGQLGSVTDTACGRRELACLLRIEAKMMARLRFGKRLYGAHVDRGLLQLDRMLRPRGRPQEGVLNISWLLAQYGEMLVPAILEVLETPITGHLVLEVESHPVSARRPRRAVDAQ